MPTFTITADVEVEFQIWCDECGAGLCHTVRPAEQKGNGHFYIAPCKACIEEAKKEGHDEGFEAGLKEANDVV